VITEVSFNLGGRRRSMNLDGSPFVGVLPKGDFACGGINPFTAANGSQCLRQKGIRIRFAWKWIWGEMPYALMPVGRLPALRCKLSRVPKRAASCHEGHDTDVVFSGFDLTRYEVGRPHSVVEQMLRDSWVPKLMGVFGHLSELDDHTPLLSPGHLLSVAASSRHLPPTRSRPDRARIRPITVAPAVTGDHPGAPYPTRVMA
jgi:hypothetical protein